MGNEDLIIIINNRPIIIRKERYNEWNEAIKMAIDEWIKQQEHTIKICDFPEEIECEIKSIRVYPVDIKLLKKGDL